MKIRQGDRLGRLVEGFDIGPEAPEGFHPVSLGTRRGIVECRHYPVADGAGAVIWIGGAGGGFDTPAQGLYPRLCRELCDDGIASLRVRFRHPMDLDESTHDVLAGIGYLERDTVAVAGIVGHSLGGAVAIRAGAIADPICTIVTLATQSFGAGAVGSLAPRCSILLVHGTADRMLPPSCSETVYSLAGGTKELRLIHGAGHSLDEAAEELHDVVGCWLRRNLGGMHRGS